MRPRRFRVRTLMMAVVVVALAVWGSMMGSLSYEYYAHARMNAEKEAYWRDVPRSEASTKTAEYHAGLAVKYRRAMWCPWLRVDPDP